MKQSIIFQAFQDHLNEILIYYQGKATSFIINQQEYPAKLIISEANINIYKVEMKLDFETTYQIQDHHFNTTFLMRRYVVKTPEFDDYFYYKNNDLGPTYQKDQTTFKVWAPLSDEGYVKYLLDGKTYLEPLNKKERGIFQTTINKDLAHATYCYLLKTNQEWVEVTDPYSYSCTTNGKYSAVIDLKQVNIPLFEETLPPFNKNTDAIIYEVNVRDFSSDNLLGKDVNNQFLAFCKEGLRSTNQHPIGLDYLTFLGITHVQLMPITDFVTVDEKNIKAHYNWGYDPASINCFEGSYSSNPDNHYTRILEAKQMIQSFHKNGLRVVLDLVLNHYFYTYENQLNRLVPYYFLQLDANNRLSNGTFCGNDYDSKSKMGQKYLVDICKRFVQEYKVDGFRLDLMGILDIDTVNQIYEKCKQINPNFILYGEGWNMPSALEENQRASLQNACKLSNIAFFNDFYRDIAKGKNFDKELQEQGYLNGNLTLVYEMVKAMKGSINPYCYFDDASQSINYVSCHDNATLHDKLEISNENDEPDVKNNITLMMLACVIFSLGIPFLHMGSEFHRTKKGNTNSYNAPDSINAINWKLVDKYFENCLALKGFIRLRKKYNVFSLHQKSDIEKHFNFEVLQHNVLKIYYKNLEEIDGIDELVMFINPTSQTLSYDFHHYYKFVCGEHGPIQNDIYSSNVMINPYSFSMYIKEIERK